MFQKIVERIVAEENKSVVSKHKANVLLAVGWTYKSIQDYQKKLEWKSKQIQITDSFWMPFDAAIIKYKNLAHVNYTTTGRRRLFKKKSPGMILEFRKWSDSLVINRN